MRSLDESMRTLNRVVEMACKEADYAEATLSGGKSGVTRFSDNVVNQAADLNADQMHLRLIVNGREARVSTTDMSDKALGNLLRQCATVARNAPAAPELTSLPNPQEYVALDAFDPETDRAGVVDRMSVVGSVIIRAHSHGLAASGCLATGAGTPAIESIPSPDVYAVHNSNGLFAYHAATHASLSVSMLDERLHTGWAKASSFMLGAINSDGIAEVAAQKACAPGELRALKSGRYRCIIEPAAMAQLLSYLGNTSGAQLMKDGNSYLSDRQGEKITSEKVTIRDDFAHEQLRGVPFDIEGIARKSVPLIENGIAKGPVYSWDSAKSAGQEPTGHTVFGSDGARTEAAHHLVMDGGETDLVDLVNECEQAILISGFCAIRLIDPRSLTLTGTTRNGTFLVRGGQVICPVQNMSFSVSLFDLFDSIEDMSTVIVSENTVAPAVRVSDFGLVQLQGS